MEFDKDKIDEMTLALLYMVMWDEKIGSSAWKGFDWETMNRLHEKGYIGNPVGKAKSVSVTPEGRRTFQEALRTEELKYQASQDRTIFVIVAIWVVAYAF